MFFRKCATFLHVCCEKLIASEGYRDPSIIQIYNFSARFGIVAADFSGKLGIYTYAFAPDL
jgi:hypothetical protein